MANKTMTKLSDEAILKRVISLASKNGYRWYLPEGVKYFEDEEAWLYTNDGAYFASLNAVIFDHSFCKALWGEGAEFYIQELALSENRLQYLAQFVEKI